MPSEGQGLDRSAVGSLWRQTLAHVPSLFGRLVYLRGLRGATDGRYQHQGLALRFGEDEAHEALLESHEETFASWLGRTIQQQKDDLDLYFTDPSVDPRQAVEAWLHEVPDVAPLTIRESERHLYRIDFDALLEVVRNEYNISRPNRED